MSAEQLELPVDPTLADLAWAWMHTPGGRHVMRDLYALADRYSRTWKRTGVPVSVKLVFEVERQRIKETSARALRICRARGIRWERPDGYTLNNSFTAYVARHMMSRRPEWAGLFEVRELRENAGGAKP